MNNLKYTPNFHEGMKGTTRKTNNKPPSIQRRNRTSTLLGTETILQSIAHRTYQQTQLVLENTSTGVQYVANGHWAVPVEQRPKNWQSWNIPEKQA